MEKLDDIFLLMGAMSAFMIGLLICNGIAIAFCKIATFSSKASRSASRSSQPTNIKHGHDYE